jgi:hypothetical protein
MVPSASRLQCVTNSFGCHGANEIVPNVTSAGPTQWTTDNATANTQRDFPRKGQQVHYHRDGTKS